MTVDGGRRLSRLLSWGLGLNGRGVYAFVPAASVGTGSLLCARAVAVQRDRQHDMLSLSRCP
jgi:hypothetical protein